MRNKDIASAIIGGSFFAAGYLLLSVPLAPALVVGTGAFVASELVISTAKERLKDTNKSLYNTLERAKKQNKHLISMIPAMNDEEIRKDLNEITNSVDQIINACIKKPQRADGIYNFFSYYLPATVKIVDRVDEIENENLSSKESKKFLTSSKKLIKEASNAFDKIVSKLYQTEIVDSDADMKVFNTMLKSDGYNEEIVVEEDSNE